MLLVYDLRHIINITSGHKIFEFILYSNFQNNWTIVHWFWAYEFHRKASFSSVYLGSIVKIVIICASVSNIVMSTPSKTLVLIILNFTELNWCYQEFFLLVFVSNKPREGRTDEKMRYDGMQHLPKWSENRLRCKLESCSVKSNIFCVKCNVHLCMNKNNNCFLEYHTRT